MKRRSFFGAIGAAAVGGQALAKQAIAATTEALAGTGVGISGASIGGMGMPVGINPPSDPSQIAWHSSRLSLIKLAKTIGIPGFKLKEMRDQARYSALDLDIASFVSVSPMMKVQMQRDRAFQRQIDTWEDWPKQEIERAMWSQANGGNLP